MRHIIAKYGCANEIRSELMQTFLFALCWFLIFWCFIVFFFPPPHFCKKGRYSVSLPDIFVNLSLLEICFWWCKLLFIQWQRYDLFQQMIYISTLGGEKAWRLNPDSALGFGLRLPMGEGSKFQQVFISAYKLNYKAPETKWGSWANAPALENCVSGSDKIEGLTWQTEFSVQWKWLRGMGQKVIHSIESNQQSIIISCVSISKWKMTGVSSIVSAVPDCLLVGHCTELRAGRKVEKCKEHFGTDISLKGGYWVQDVFLDMERTGDAVPIPHANSSPPCTYT